MPRQRFNPSTSQLKLIKDVKLSAIYIANKIGCGVSTILNYRKFNGIKPDIKSIKSKPRIIFSNSDLKLIKNENLSSIYLAKKIACSFSAICRYRKKNGIKFRGRKINFTKAQLKLIENVNLSHSHVARKIGRSVTSIINHRKINEIKYVSIKKQKIFSNSDLKLIENTNLSNPYVAKRIGGCSSSTIWNYRKNNDIHKICSICKNAFYNFTFRLNVCSDCRKPNKWNFNKIESRPSSTRSPKRRGRIAQDHASSGSVKLSLPKRISKMLTFHPIPWFVEKPRTWQIEAFNATRAHFERPGVRIERAVIRAIMGSGKSILISHLCAAVKTRDIVLVTAPTELLVEQLSEDISAACSAQKVSVGMYYGKCKKFGRVMVACTKSVPKLIGKLRERGEKVSLLIIDEAHKSEAEEFFAAVQEMNPDHILGLTATPFLNDMRKTLRLFETQIVNYGADRALKDGVVVPYHIEPYRGDPERDLDQAVIDTISSASGPGLISAVSIADAESFARRCTDAGIPCLPIHSRQSRAENKTVIKKLLSGELRAAVDVNMLSEGANYPWLSWLALRRETKSRVLFLQRIGRGLRAYTGKKFCTFYDFHDLFGTFPLTVQEALGEPPPQNEAERIARGEAEDISIKIRDPIMSLAIIEGLIRRLIVACDASGMLGSSRIVMSKTERMDDSNRFQVAKVRTATEEALPYIPENWKGIFQYMAAEASKIRKGFLVDLMISLISIERRKEFPPMDIDGKINSGVEVELDYSRGNLQQLEFTETKNHRKGKIVI